MSARAGLRVALGGAGGAVGEHVVALLAERRFPLGELLPFGTDRSLGRDVEIGDEVIAIETEAPPLRGYDLLVVCTPRGAALELVRLALHAEVACIDCSGALAVSPEVPLCVADLGPSDEALAAPAVAIPSGPALAWAAALGPLARAAGLARVSGTVMQSAAHAGNAGIEALSDETIARLSGRDPNPSDVFPDPVAFDCLPEVGEADAAGDEAGATPGERELAANLRRLLGEELLVSATAVQVPTFVGEGSALAIETHEPIEPAEAEELLAKAEGVELWSGTGAAPSTRDASSNDAVLVGRVRRDPSRERGLLLWLAADPPRLAALSAVKLAEARLRLG